MTDTEFAFGRDEVDGCKCPASRCGYNPKDKDASTKVAEGYDVVLKNKTGDRTGTVDEETAKNAWLKAKEQAPDEQAGVSAGEEVAEELGWSDE